ncbi:MAG: ferritin family protein [Deltaproteobacteria bacterium]|nr:ferritin family protein [Deltaproteobacteria bacterium]
MGTVTTQEILKQAIAFEELSYSFYMRLKDAVLDAMTKDSLEYLAREEVQHKDFLQKYLEGALPGKALGLTEVHDGKIVEFFHTPAAAPDLPSKDAFLIAADKEKKSHEFYLKLADLHPEGEIKDLLRKLAQEELAHKEKMEYLYVNAAFPQTAGG